MSLVLVFVFQLWLVVRLFYFGFNYLVYFFTSLFLVQVRWIMAFTVECYRYSWSMLNRYSIDTLVDTRSTLHPHLSRESINFRDLPLRHISKIEDILDWYIIRHSNNCQLTLWSSDICWALIEVFKGRNLQSSRCRSINNYWTRFLWYPE